MILPRERPEDEDDDAVGGFPEDGDPLELGNEGDETPPAARKKEEDDPLAGLQRQIEALQRDNESLKRQLPPATAKPVVETKKDETDWNNLLFTDPAGAVAKIKQEAKEEATRELTQNYNKAESSKAFWRKFYAKNKDLRGDHDLVEVTLNSNLSTLANVEVDTAMERLADLTRQRILRYTGSASSNRGKKARAEGSEPPTPKKQEEEVDEPVRLSDIIKARRAKRASAA